MHGHTNIKLTYHVHLVGIEEVIQRLWCCNGEPSNSLLPAPQIFLSSTRQQTSPSPAITRSRRGSKYRRWGLSPLCEALIASYRHRIAVLSQAVPRVTATWTQLTVTVTCNTRC